MNSFANDYSNNLNIAVIFKLKEELSYSYIVRTNDVAAIKNFLSEFQDSENVNAAELLVLKKEAIGRRVRSYRTVSFVVDSVNIFMGFGIERKAEYVVVLTNF